MKTLFDLTIIGSGPSALSAAINAASEGLSTLVLEKSQSLGGQAGSSSLIENYVGFPQGVSGQELMHKSMEQAFRFGVEFRAPFNANCLSRDGESWDICSDDGDEHIYSKSILLAMGVDYRSLNAKNLARFIGCGVSYGSPSISDRFCNKAVVVVGGANSAGQAAVHLASCSDCNVILLIRGNSIADKMSTYLINKINNHPNITVMCNTEIVEAKGGIGLEALSLNSNGENIEIPVSKVFILIGAKPKTNWLRGTIDLDSNGFIITGQQTINKNFLSMETSQHGIFAAGDVRSGSVKRVASAVGEGARAVNDIHTYLGSLK